MGNSTALEIVTGLHLMIATLHHAKLECVRVGTAQVNTRYANVGKLLWFYHD